MNRTRGIAIVLLTGLGFGGTFTVSGDQSGAGAKPALVRGNVPGEWRYWGGDAWSTRYSPLDQINASNFGTLQVAWQWNAGAFGQDEYYRTTPLYANGRLFTVATTRRDRRGDRSRERRDALDVAAGRRHPLAEGAAPVRRPRAWPTGPTAASERVIVVTPGYHMASLDAKTGLPDPKFGKNGIVDLMDGLGFPLVPLAVDDAGPLVISDAAPARKARPGETWDAATKTGADGTVGIDPALGQIGASCPPIIVNDVIIVGNSHIHGYYPIRLRNLPSYIRGFDVRTGKQFWKFNLVPRAGRVRRRDVEERLQDRARRASARTTRGRRTRPIPELGLVYIPVGMPLMDEYGGHRPGNNLFGNSLVALDVKTGKRKWHFQMVHHDIWDYDTPMAPNLLDVTVDGKPRKIIAQTTQAGLGLRVRSRDRRADLADRRDAGAAERGARRADVADAADSEQARAVLAAGTRRSRSHRLHAGDQGRGAQARAGAAAWGRTYIPASPGDGTAPSGLTCSWYAPGASGGVNIDGGAAVDPETGMLYVGGADRAEHDAARRRIRARSSATARRTTAAASSARCRRRRATRRATAAAAAAHGARPTTSAASRSSSRRSSAASRPTT